VVSFAAGGVFLHLLVDRALWGFALLFGLGFASRVASFGLLSHLYEMPAAATSRVSRSAAVSMRGLWTSNLGRYMLFLFAMSFAVNLSGPYFTVYLLRDLGVSYLMFTVLHALNPLANLVAVTFWGRAADKAGNLKMIFLASVLVPSAPLLFALTSDLHFMALVQVLSGIAWAGFNLCTVNYLYDATTPENRTRVLSWYNAGNGLAVGLGAFTGGYLAPILPELRGSAYVTLFIISGSLRVLVPLAFLPFLREVRRVSHLSATELFHVLMGGRPVHGKMAHKRFHLIHHHEAG
jgi:MFS family permease